MKIKSGFVVRRVGTDVYAISTRAERNGMIKMNESAAALWDFFTEAHSAEEGAEYLFRRYVLSLGQARTETERFLKLLRENDILE